MKAFDRGDLTSMERVMCEFEQRLRFARPAHRDQPQYLEAAAAINKARLALQSLCHADERAE